MASELTTTNHRFLSSHVGTCDGGIFTYEKTTGHFLRTAQQEPLPVEVTTPGITMQCAGKCSGFGSDCPAFSVDYGGQRCYKMDRNTQVQLIALFVTLPRYVQYRVDSNPDFRRRNSTSVPFIYL